MATMTLRNIDDSLKESLRMRAAANGRSMEEEARQILRQALSRDKCAKGIGTRIALRFAAAGGVDLPTPQRSMPRRPDVAADDESRFFLIRMYFQTSLAEWDNRYSVIFSSVHPQAKAFNTAARGQRCPSSKHVRECLLRPFRHAGNPAQRDLNDGVVSSRTASYKLF